jgi:hypothetical protein
MQEMAAFNHTNENDLSFVRCHVLEFLFKNFCTSCASAARRSSDTTTASPVVTFSAVVNVPLMDVRTNSLFDSCAGFLRSIDYSENNFFGGGSGNFHH